MRVPAALLIVLVALLAGCGRRTAPQPTVTGPPPAPKLVATQPPARGDFALYDTDIWGQFSRPLDASTVSPTTVFLKLDGQRHPITARYDYLTRRILIHPTVTLELQRTYTVEFSTSVHGADGTPLPPNLYFQFKTNSVRRVSYDFPLAGDLEGPLATLGWGGAQGPSGNILYEVYASTDSLEVERRQSPLSRSVLTRFVPSVSWPMGRTIYWTVTSENATTHERLPGAVQAFRVLDPGTPIDSVVIVARDHGSSDIRSRTTQDCNRLTMSCGPSFNCSLHWYLAAIPPNVRFASATIRLTATDVFGNVVQFVRPTVWMAQNDWVPCSIVAPGPPFTELSGELAEAVGVGSVGAELTSGRLGAFLEAQYRGRSLLHGTLIRSSQNILFHSSIAEDPAKRPQTVLRFYRLPAAPGR